jgi:hypothetical protein
MRRFLHGRSTPATVLAIVALVIAATGGAYAATSSTSATLPSGHSESGMFGAGGGYTTCTTSCGYLGADITYPQSLATPIPNKHIVDVHGNSAPHCPGIGHAAPGYLCLYEKISSDIDHGYGYSSDSYFTKPSRGVVLYWQIAGAGKPYSGGEWTVTAP